MVVTRDHRVQFPDQISGLLHGTADCGFGDGRVDGAFGARPLPYIVFGTQGGAALCPCMFTCEGTQSLLFMAD